MKTKNIVTFPVDLSFDMTTNQLTVKSQFNNKEYIDTITYSIDGNHEFHLNNLYTFVEHEMLQKNVTNEDITKSIEKSFIGLIDDIIESFEHLKKLTDEKCTKWRNKAGIIVYNDVATVGDYLSRVDFLSSNFPCISAISDKDCHNIEESYVCKDYGVVITSKGERATMIFEF